ncbi:HPr kinase/phosphorylase [Pseudoponticoccus marisrubri]|uniref:Serine kinase n=1 Tax=Pseudoponticoccus marisrubri TaxID=1685382 RepID=A0A0W7WHG0_9RHOB|nr:HPr kinase/phosphatase C-terminal domain-containing protein [Pseudoponticoccus marisrubri]KUF10091.1 serine kinase [Pseudoponticoccus marisrubri]
MPPSGPLIVHATSVAVGGRALLIRGASGRGKSGLALEMMCRGASLVADDRTILTRKANTVWLDVPPAIRGLIEARGLGLLHAPVASPARLVAILDLDREEAARLPRRRSDRVLGLDFPLLHNSASPYFPASLVHYLTYDRRDGDDDPA